MLNVPPTFQAWVVVASQAHKTSVAASDFSPGHKPYVFGVNYSTVSTVTIGEPIEGQAIDIAQYDSDLATDALLRRPFRHLADKWHEETDALSFASEIVSNLNYLRIIALGPRAVSLILEDLRERGGQWYVALNVLTGEWPVPPEANGFPLKMDQSWFDWARRNGYAV